jgi:hypothetical protein
MLGEYRPTTHADPFSIADALNVPAVTFPARGEATEVASALIMSVA